METRLRMVIVLAGLPEPKVNHVLPDLAGEWLARLDLSYPAYRLIIEYDGRQHAEDSRQWHRDLERREQLETLGWQLVIVTSKRHLPGAGPHFAAHRHRSAATGLPGLTLVRRLARAVSDLLNRGWHSASAGLADVVRRVSMWEEAQVTRQPSRAQ